MFISFEGIDGCGKTTQAEMLCDYFKSNGKKVILTKEPGGGGQFSLAIRKLLSTSDTLILSELLAIYAARNEHIKKVIIPHLNNNFIVICDRFIDSSIAYYCYNDPKQICISSKSRQLIQTLQTAVGDIMPDITILIDTDPVIAEKRRNSRLHQVHKYDFDSLDKVEKIRNSYLELANQESERIFKINGDEDVNVVFNNIIDYLINTVKKVI